MLMQVMLMQVAFNSHLQYWFLLVHFQGRLFSYSDTHKHRLGPNYQQIPVNKPLLHSEPNNYQRDGSMCVDSNGGNAPNYYPNSFS